LGTLWKGKSYFHFNDQKDLWKSESFAIIENLIDVIIVEVYFFFNFLSLFKKTESHKRGENKNQISVIKISMTEQCDEEKAFLKLNQEKGLILDAYIYVD
jgi:competence protein ComGC